MNVVFDYQIFANQKVGGISRYCIELVKHLIKLDVEPEIVAPLYIGSYLSEIDKSRIYGFKNPSFLKDRHIRNFINKYFFERYCRKTRPDIVHRTYYREHSRLANSKTKYVLTVHDMIEELHLEKTKKVKILIDKKRKAISASDHIICVSENTKKDLLNIYDIDPANVSTIHLGVAEVFTKVKNLKSPVSKPFILNVGQRGAYKNFDFLVDIYASEKVINQNFDLVTFGGRDFKLDERQRFRDLGIMEKIHWFGGNDLILRDLYNSASAFVFPSLYEGFGLPPIEAMRCDCPVICSNGGSIPEIVGDAGAYFDPKDPNSLKIALYDVLFNGDSKQLLIEKGRNRSNQLSWGKCAQETANVYRKLCES